VEVRKAATGEHNCLPSLPGPACDDLLDRRVVSMAVNDAKK
jgi:hypothetical protein